MKSAYKYVGVCPTAASQKKPYVMKLVIYQHLAASSTWTSNCTSLQQDNNRSSATFGNVNFRVVVRSRFAAPDGADEQGEDSDYLRGNRGTTPCSYGGWGLKCIQLHREDSGIYLVRFLPLTVPSRL